MLYLTVSRGRLKRNTSVEDLNNALQEVINYNPRLSLDIYNNIKGIIYVDSRDNYNEFDILKIMTKYCRYFKIVIDEDDYHESRFTSEYLIITNYYEWDGKDLLKRTSNFFGPTWEKENYNWILK